MKPLRILALEPYYGGSHRAFLDTWIEHSRHAWMLETLPAHHWKWRMRGSAIWFADRLKEAPAGGYDALFTCDMTSVTDLRALLPPHLTALPIICYFHENQLTYPLSPNDWRDYQFGLTNITSALASDSVWFNSDSHRQAFLNAVDQLLRKMPDFVPANVVDRINGKSAIQYPALDMTETPTQVATAESASRPVRILWSHRWEYDKNPESFVNVLLRLMDAEIEFELVMLGEQFRTAPEAFRDATDRLETHVVHSGYVDSRLGYLDLVASCDVVISTAIQENFGLAVVEAMMCGCYPLLPNSLSYPELLPEPLRARVLYDTDAQLFQRLAEICEAQGEERQNLLRRAESLPDYLLDRFGASRGVEALDSGLEDVVATFDGDRLGDGL